MLFYDPNRKQTQLPIRLFLNSLKLYQIISYIIKPFLCIDGILTIDIS